MHSLADSQDKEVGDVEDLVLAEEWSCVRARRLVADDTDDLLLGSEERLEVGLAWIVAAPPMTAAQEQSIFVVLQLKRLFPKVFLQMQL